VGSLEIYRQTHIDALGGRCVMKFPMPEVRKYVWIGENVEIDPSAEIAYPVAIGNDCRIEAGAKVLEKTVLGDRWAVGSGGVVKQSIRWDAGAVWRDPWTELCVVGRDCRVKTNAAISDGVIVAPPAKRVYSQGCQQVVGCESRSAASGAWKRP